LTRAILYGSLFHREFSRYHKEDTMKTRELMKHIEQVLHGIEKKNEENKMDKRVKKTYKIVWKNLEKSWLSLNKVLELDQ